MAQLINIRLNRPENCPLGFRLQGGKDFGTPLVIQKVNGGSPAEKAGLQAGDSVIKVNTTDVFSLRHKEAQDVIVKAGQNFDLTVQRGGSTWKPSVTPVGSLPSPSAGKPYSVSPVTQTSLKANQQPVQHIGSGYNSAAKPFNYMNGNGETVKSIVNKQYNTPVGMYSEETIAETLSAQAEVLAGGVLGVNFKKNEKIYDAEKSEVFKMLQEADNDPEPEASVQAPASGTVTGLRHVTAPVTRPDAPVNNTGGLPPGQNICEECERLIIGVFVRIKDKNLHVECFKCATCGSSLKNQGYYNLNGKLYCDIHAKMVARQNPPAPNLEPVTVLPKLPSSTISSALSSHSMPLPPLSNPIPSLSGNGPAPFSQTAGDQTDDALSLKIENVEAFASILTNGDAEKHNNSTVTQSHSNSCANPNQLPPSCNTLEKNENSNKTIGNSNVCNIKSMNGFNSISNTTTNSVYKKVIPPHMGGNYKPSSNISGPKPFGAPISPVAPPSACSISPRSLPSMTSSAPISPASTLQRPMQQAPAAQPLPAKSVRNIVWPPKNPPDDEEPEEEPTLPFNIPPKTTPSPKPYRTEPAPVIPAPWLVKQSRSDPDSHHVKFSDHVEEKILDESSSFKTIEGECSSIQTSAMSAHSSSFAQSSQKYAVTESCSLQENISCSSQKSSMVVSESHQSSECAMQQRIYLSKTGEPIQTTYDLPLTDSSAKIDSELKSVFTTESKMIEETSQIARHKESICSAEVSNITERKSPMECVETISEAIDCQNLVLSLTPGNLTPRPPSPTPEDVCSPIIEKKSFEETIKDSENTIVTTCEKKSVSEQSSSNTKSEVCQFKVNQENEMKQEERRSSDVTTTLVKGSDSPLVTALTIAPERPFSPLPPTTQAPVCVYKNKNIVEAQESACMLKKAETIAASEEPIQEKTIKPIPVTSSVPTEPECPRGKVFSSIPPIKPYVPKPAGDAIPMPKETVPYFPPDICIKVEPKPPRTGAVSPFVAALTVAPERPYTPLGSQPIEMGSTMGSQAIERGSLVEALTIAPERPFTPANEAQMICPLQTICTIPQTSTSLECIKPIATQPSQTSIAQTSRPPVQTVCQIQSTQSSAFKPVVKTIQTFPPPPPEEFSETLNRFPPVSDELKSHYSSSSTQNRSEIVSSQSSTSQSQQIFESQQNKSCSKSEFAVCTFEKKEKLTSSAKRETSGLHKPETLPCYQINLEQLPSQRGKTPEVINEPPILQKPVTPTIAQESDDPHVKKVQHSQQVESSINQIVTTSMATHTTSILKSSHESQKIMDYHGDVPISMTFQPVTDDMFSRTTPTIRSRPITPSLINKPAPLIPFYQMNLVSVEHDAPQSNLFEPSSPEVSRSPTPKLRSRSPAVGPPPNPLKAHAPRTKDEVIPQHQNHTLIAQATSNLRREHDIKANFQSGVEVYNSSGAKNWSQNQQSVVKTQQQLSKIGFHHTENVTDSNIHTSISEASYMNQQSMQQKSESQTVCDTGSSSVQRTKKVFEEFERSQTAKVIEIQKSSGGTVTKSISQFSTSEPTSMYQTFIRRSSESNVDQSKSLEFKSLANTCQQPCTLTNSLKQTNVSSTCHSAYNPTPFASSGANNKISGPVCDPTPSTGAAGSGAGRGKTFGVSSAPKRGRGILNKAAGPGSRIALCAHCNGQIRGPFITALGRIWCPEHFVCVNNTCRRQLQDIGFVEENGQLYCEYCFEQFIAPACDKCHAKIKGDCLNAIGKHFHPECFNCAYCGKLFGNNPFFLEEGLPYCEADWNELFTTKCFACGFPVEAGDRWVEALNNNYHSQCFNCTMCKKNLEGQSFYAKGGRPFCKNHAR